VLEFQIGNLDKPFYYLHCNVVVVVFILAESG